MGASRDTVRRASSCQAWRQEARTGQNMVGWYNESISMGDLVWLSGVG
jgi:hypothetical protein